MKKIERLPYLILTEVCFSNGGNATLCSFCKYGKWEGDSCCEGFYECKHPLWKVQELSEIFGQEPGDGVDCWGFRPAYNQEDCVDMVGIWLQGKTVDITSLEVKCRKSLMANSTILRRLNSPAAVRGK